MSRRSRAREVVLQVLYQDDLNPPADLTAAEEFLRNRLKDETLVAFASSLLAGVRGKRSELDELLAKRADNWSLARMAATDRNVLRLGAYEILFTETPDRVAINEAVELAKRFGAKQSPPFVNGVLDRFLQKPREGEIPPALATVSEMAVLRAAEREASGSGIHQNSGMLANSATGADLTVTDIKTPAVGKRIPSAEEYAKALQAIAEKPAERKFPAYFRTLLKTHRQHGAQTAAELAEAMGWEDAAVVLGRYGDLGKRLGEELHFDPPLYDAAGVPLWISVLAITSEGGERSPETSRWELREELAEALGELGWY